MPQFSVMLGKLASQLRIETEYTPKPLDEIPIYAAEVNRPGILFAGYSRYFDAARIQVCGKVEHSYLEDLPPAGGLRANRLSTRVRRSAGGRSSR